MKPARSDRIAIAGEVRFERSSKSKYFSSNATHAWTSRTVAGFWLVHALQLGGGLGPVMEELFSMITAGRLKPVIGGSYPLAEAPRAHEELLSRRTIGKLVLTTDGHAGEAAPGGAE